jgi:hypothetical protein
MASGGAISLPITSSVAPSPMWKGREWGAGTKLSEAQRGGTLREEERALPEDLISSRFLSSSLVHNEETATKKQRVTRCGLHAVDRIVIARSIAKHP